MKLKLYNDNNNYSSKKNKIKKLKQKIYMQIKIFKYHGGKMNLNN